MTDKFILQLSLKNRVYLVNAVLLCITVIGAVLMVWYTYKTEKIFKDIIDKNIVIYQSAEALGTSLVNQKGLVSYYLLDHDPAWIDQLSRYRLLFDEYFITVKSLVEEPWEKNAVDQIESKYKYYVTIKDQVIELYKAGEYDKGFVLHKDIRQDFFKIMELCEQFKSFHKKKIADAIKTSRIESNHLRYVALMAIITVVVLSLLINYIFARHILGPIRKLAAEADRLGNSKSPTNEVAALKQSVHGLIENAEQTHQELKRSRETLMQSEKMALLGKLAAGTSHSIRNPLTSVKMRLFSLNRSCDFTKYQKEDFNVISGEIKQINKIVENFLEFARPPKLNIKRMSPSIVVDNALHLLEQRLESYHVTTRLIRHRPLSDTFIDPEQLKEVIVNIIINACEAMDKSGLIIIHEEESHVEPLKKVDVIRIIDDGPGIPQEIKEQIFNPFFTTKEEGTGLGLSIAFNIINEHGGWLDVSSEEGQGSSFVITLPIKDS
ncbi:ATP-binding protein [Desulfobacula sp.]|uniref:ATP-binding protein n=1 Tax=Desulfobacula sp. TaxID=2593537 RepID=UPI0025B7CC46|nr:ATP-binding protein [Desulfobacula sp.]MBC2703219.1 MCP four helix bundle domain-containing protein [Desulfobacula sp.]